MIRQPTEHDLNERIEIWGYVRYWMKKLRISPMQLAQRTRLPQDKIERGIKGKPEPIMHVLGDLVDAFGLVSGRQKSFEDTSDILSPSEHKALLKPPTMSPYQSNLWDD